MLKTAVITGGAKRIGRATALMLANRGFDVAVHYNSSAEEANELVHDIASLGQSAVAIPANLLDEVAVRKILPAASHALGKPIGVLINNASIFEPDDVATGTRDSWDRAVESNLRAPVVLTQALAKQAPIAVPEAETGEPIAQALVINMLDQRVRKLTPAFMSYTIAKMGLWAFTQTAAQALAPHIRVNAIGPGPTIKNERQTDAHFAKQRESLILKRGPTPEDITAAIAYFLDARTVTGQLLCIDGGQHLAWETPDVGVPE
ncbi:MAG: SDR family oxidoreductase [Pseudomonadota bacterium]